MHIDIDQIMRKKVIKSNKLYSLFLDLVDSGPFDGGCLLLAKALQKVYGGEVYVIEGVYNGHRTAQHAVLKLKGDLYADADGIAYGDELVKRFERLEDVTDGKLRPYKNGDLPDAPATTDMVDQVAAYLIKGIKTEGVMSKAKKVSTLLEDAQDFDQALKAFIADSQEKIDKHEAGYKLPGRTKLVTTSGQKFIRIVSERDGGTGRSAWAFIDKSNGDILKPASWKVPAKHARGNIYKPETWTSVSVYGPAYLK